MSPIATVPGGTFSDVGVLNVNQAGDETLEVWLRPYVGVAGSSGVAQEVATGVWVGAGDFSEFALQGAGALPAGLTGFSFGTGNFEIIELDTPTKRVWRRNEGTDNLYAIAYDGFDDLFQMGGEILARGYINTVAGSGLRHKMSFGVFTDDGLGGFDDGLGIQGFAFSNSFRWSGGQWVGGTFAGLTSEPNEGDPIGAFGAGFVWFRIRLDDAGSGNVRFRLHFTASDFDAPPAVPGVWDVDETVAAAAVFGGAGTHLGFLRNIIGPRQASDRAWSFIGFTSDYTVQVAPGNVSEVGGSAPGAWVLAKSVAVSAVEDQVVRVDGLDPGTLHDVALRYRRGLKYNPGAENTADPTTWPSVSRGQFSTTIDPPTFVSAVWERTSAIAEQITVTVTPLAGSEAEDINVYREKFGEGSPTLIGTISGPHVGDVSFIDTTIEGEKRYFYSFTTAAAEEGAQSAQQQIWSGPPEIPVFLYQLVIGGGYAIGFDTPTDTTQGLELEDTYDNLGAETSFALRQTLDPIGGASEITTAALVNVPAPSLTFTGQMRFKQTAFAVEDFGEYTSPGFSITVPESE